MNNCRFCKKELEHLFMDLGHTPFSNAYLYKEQLHKPEINFPLRIYVCDDCWMVQTEDFATREELFTDDYPYYSSTSLSWLKHCEDYSNKIIDLLELNQESCVVEIAANDGYLLKNFKNKDIPCFGFEPTKETAEAASKQGINIIQEFFGVETSKVFSKEHGKADLIIGNNVYAHVPDINDFTCGMKDLLKSGGTINLEFPHNMRLIESAQFDTIYHEHFSYISLHTVNLIFKEAGLKIYDVQELSSHAGSLRIYGCHIDDPREISDSFYEILLNEEKMGLRDLKTYLEFQLIAENIKNNFLGFLLEQKNKGKVVCAYGAAAKGCTFLNFAGVRKDLISFICDAASSKQGKFMPSSHIPIYSPDKIQEIKPDIVIILPWNLEKEITNQLSYIRDWGGKFCVASPDIKVF
jgi:SAM-dependent methyltransferase